MTDTQSSELKMQLDVILPTQLRKKTFHVLQKLSEVKK